ncbi:hypothetical protein SEUCBS140593_002412 [Sporothrix eucalyptigena]|uniref:Caspase domain-containing protein n=1 Tax=Sporothrix eucalyptigena TaxID=1812306 RepID=A0ABP0B6H7_9PEZI
MDPPNKRRRLAPKLPDPPPSPKKSKGPKTAKPTTMTVQPTLVGPEQVQLPSTEPPTSNARDGEKDTATERHDFETFAKHLQDAAMYIYRQGQKLPYAKVSALLLKWDEDVTASTELSSLERVLRDRYNFTTERWGIPSIADPGALLSSRIASFLDHASVDHLLIIYYVGYGHNSLDNQLYWSCNSREDSPRLKWSVVRGAIEDAHSDVLLLLDSCAPRHMPISGSNGVKQAIAAYTHDASLRELGARTFTSYLTESLQKLGNGRPFNSQHLYDDIIAIQQNYEHYYPPRVKYNATGKPATIAPSIPLFFTLTPTKATIDLAPVPRGHQSPQAHNGGSSVSQAAGDDTRQARDAPVISPAAVADMVFDEPRLLVCTTFVGDPGPDMTSFNQWIADTPSLASKVAVEGMFLGPPTVFFAKWKPNGA